jgi:hypothetical protein
MGFKIDKTQAIGAVAIASVALGLSWYQGKLDKFLGKDVADTAGMFERKLPPPVEGVDPLIATEQQATEVSNEDVLANLAGEPSSTDTFLTETASVEPTVERSEASLADDPLAAIAAALPAQTNHGARIDVGIAPSAQLASSDPSKLIHAGVAFSNVTPSAKSEVAPASVPVSTQPAAPSGPRVFGAPGGDVNAPVPTHTSLPDPSLGAPLPTQLPEPVPHALNAKAGSAPSLPATTSVPSIPSLGPAPTGSSQVLATTTGGAADYSGGSALAAAAIASLPTNATGKDLLELQTQLAVLDKQKAIAAGVEAIAESPLKAAKAVYEMSQIGQPTAEERAAIAAARAAAQVNQVQMSAAPATLSAIDSAKLLSTTRANGGIGATLRINDKLVDVKKGSVVAGLLVDKVTDNSVTLIGDGKTQTVWID